MTGKAKASETETETAEASVRLEGGYTSYEGGAVVDTEAEVNEGVSDQPDTAEADDTDNAG